jgi:hypothetical protein
MFSLVVVALFALPFRLPFLLPLPHLKKASMANISNIAGIKRMIPLLELEMNGRRPAGIKDQPPRSVPFASVRTDVVFV